MQRREAGFSMIELVTVCLVILIISALAIPQMVQVTTNYRLDASGRAVAGLLQKARLQAVQTNRPAYAQVDTTLTPNVAFVNGDPSVTTYVSPNPSVGISSYVTYSTGTPPNHAQLDAYVGGSGGASATSVQLPGTVLGLPGNVVGFNARGLPCMETGSNPLTCSQLDTTKTGSPPVSFEWFMQNSNNGWEAVTVTPAGRIKSWRLAATSGCGSSGVWACWQ